MGMASRKGRDPRGAGEDHNTSLNCEGLLYLLYSGPSLWHKNVITILRVSRISYELDDRDGGDFQAYVPDDLAC
jgi:hypothetical protein